MLVAINECHSPCRPRHSICLLPLLNPITYVHPGIPSYPSVKSSLFLPRLPRSVVPSPHPFPVSPSPLPASPSPCPHSPPPSLPLPSPLMAFASSPASLYPLPRPPQTSMITITSPLLAFASSSASLYPLPLPHRHGRSLINSNYACPICQSNNSINQNNPFKSSINQP